MRRGLRRAPEITVGQDGDPLRVPPVPGPGPQCPGVPYLRVRHQGAGHRFLGLGKGTHRGAGRVNVGGGRSSCVSHFCNGDTVGGYRGYWNPQGTGILRILEERVKTHTCERRRGGRGVEKKLGMERWGLRACFYSPKWDANVIGLEAARDKGDEECAEKERGRISIDLWGENSAIHGEKNNMKNRRKWATDRSLSAHSVEITPRRGNAHAKSHLLHANAIGAHRFE